MDETPLASNQESELVHPLTPPPAAENFGQKPKLFLVVALVGVVLLGLGTGYQLANRNLRNRGGGAGEYIKTEKEEGSKDTRVFRDTATGKLEKNGAEGEGTHKLIREGGESQTAYLTSSVLDLNQYNGKRVQVWGETFQGRKVGWLMDVGRIKILD